MEKFPLGKILKAEREKRGVGQLELAEKIGMSNTHLSAIENDKQEIKLSTLHKITSAIGVKMEDVIAQSNYGEKIS